MTKIHPYKLSFLIVSILFLFAQAPAFATDDQLIVTDTGKVGVGTSTPTHKLDVNGKIRMRRQTEVADSDDTVSTKAYVDNKYGNCMWRDGNICLEEELMRGYNGTQVFCCGLEAPPPSCVETGWVTYETYWSGPSCYYGLCSTITQTQVCKQSLVTTDCQVQYREVNCGSRTLSCNDGCGGEGGDQ